MFSLNMKRYSNLPESSLKGPTRHSRMLPPRELQRNVAKLRFGINNLNMALPITGSAFLRPAVRHTVQTAVPRTGNGRGGILCRET